MMSGRSLARYKISGARRGIFPVRATGCRRRVRACGRDERAALAARHGARRPRRHRRSGSGHVRRHHHGARPGRPAAPDERRPRGHRVGRGPAGHRLRVDGRGARRASGARHPPGAAQGLAAEHAPRLHGQQRARRDRTVVRSRCRRPRARRCRARDLLLRGDRLRVAAGRPAVHGSRPGPGHGRCVRRVRARGAAVDRARHGRRVAGGVRGARRGVRDRRSSSSLSTFRRSPVAGHPLPTGLDAPTGRGSRSSPPPTLWSTSASTPSTRTSPSCCSARVSARWPSARCCSGSGPSG